MFRSVLAAAASIVFLSTTALAELPSLNKPLSVLSIADRGEMLLQDKEVSYRPWTSQSNLGEVHVLQYFAGTSSASKIFEPFTDRLQKEFPQRGYHVTTVINLDAAMWGTGGFVTGEAKSSKKKYPDSTMVLDEDGAGAANWELGKKGAVLVVMDRAGSIIYLARKAMSEQDIAATINLVRDSIDS